MPEQRDPISSESESPVATRDHDTGEATGGQVPIATAVPGCLLAWALPGLGHVFLRRFSRGALFGVLILGLFAGGLLLGGKVYRPEPGEPLTYLAALGAAGVGLPFLLVHYAGIGDGDMAGTYFDYGNTFTLVAGLLNLLVVLDAFDVAVGRR